MSNDIWNNNEVQFPRLLAELQGILPRETVEAVAESMDLTPAQVGELLDRAVVAWQDIQSDLRWEEIERLQAEHEDTRDPKNPNHIMLEALLISHGPAKRISRARADELCAAGEGGRVLCVHRTGDDVLYGSIGFHMVDVDERYELVKPASYDLQVYGCDDLENLPYFQED